MRIVHGSDWHGNLFDLPEADLYVFSGDMLPNFRIRTIQTINGPFDWQPDAHLVGELPKYLPVGYTLERKLDPAHEAMMQAKYLKHKGPGYIRSYLPLATNQAPIVLCRGNHDFVDLKPMAAFGEFFEISKDPTKYTVITINGAKVKIGGFRGMKVHRNRWSDEITEEEFAIRCSKLPDDLDILVTHNPPLGVLDSMPVSQGLVNLGSKSLRDISTKLPSLKAHMFGHIHESFGKVSTSSGVLFSNASCGFSILDLP